MCKKKLRLLLCSLCIMAVTLALPFPAAAAPSLNLIRVGYIEGEDYYAFSHGLAGIAQGLQELGIISGFDVPTAEPDARVVWKALARSDGHERIQFVEEMFFSMKSVDETDYPSFTNSSEVDLLIVMGTVAGVYITEHENKNDYMVFAAANPIRSGIVAGETERLKPNSYAYIDPSRFKRQVDVAYNIFEFHRLGVVYENNDNAYFYSGIDQAEQSAAAHGFAIERRHVDEARNEDDMSRYYADLKAAYRELIDAGVDALYITTATTEDSKLPWLLEDVAEAGIPTISQVGENQVQNGVVLGTTLEDPTNQGRFVAACLAEYLKGTPISELEQVYEIVPKIFLNYDAARNAGLELQVKTLLSADEIYRSKP